MKCVESKILDELEVKLLQGGSIELANERHRVWWNLWEEAGYPIPEDVAERLALVNERMDKLSVEVIDKAWRIKRHIDADIEAGFTDYKGYYLRGEIVVDEIIEEGTDLVDKLIEWSYPYHSCSFSDQKDEDVHELCLALEAESWEFCNPDLRRVGLACHTHICRAFNHFFEERKLLTLDDMAQIPLNNINEFIEISI
jgi:hypothetical protein